MKAQLGGVLLREIKTQLSVSSTLERTPSNSQTLSHSDVKDVIEFEEKVK